MKLFAVLLPILLLIILSHFGTNANGEGGEGEEQDEMTSGGGGGAYSAAIDNDNAADQQHPASSDHEAAGDQQPVPADQGLTANQQQDGQRFAQPYPWPAPPARRWPPVASPCGPWGCFRTERTFPTTPPAGRCGPSGCYNTFRTTRWKDRFPSVYTMAPSSRTRWQDDYGPCGRLGRCNTPKILPATQRPANYGKHERIADKLPYTTVYTMAPTTARPLVAQQQQYEAEEQKAEGKDDDSMAQQQQQQKQQWWWLLDQ